jgi:hypothetical protein
MSAKPTRLPTPSSDEPIALTDWLEATMLVRQRRYSSRAWIRTELRNEVFPEDAEGAHDLDPSPLDIALDLIVAEVERRALFCGERYPFQVRGDGVEIVTGRDCLAYVFLLFVSISPTVRLPGNIRQVDVSFDLVVLHALREYLGPYSIGLRFGSPASGERPTRFDYAIGWLRGELRFPKGTGTTRGHTGDGGADLVAWLPFDDSLHACLVLLAQCTIQRDWYGKAADIKINQWLGWIDFGFAPVACLAIPFVITEDNPKWDETRRTMTLALERLRIAQLSASIPDDLSRRLRRWIASEIKALAA